MNFRIAAKFSTCTDLNETWYVVRMVILDIAYQILANYTQSHSQAIVECIRECRTIKDSEAINLNQSRPTIKAKIYKYLRQHFTMHFTVDNPCTCQFFVVDGAIVIM